MTVAAWFAGSCLSLLYLRCFSYTRTTLYPLWIQKLDRSSHTIRNQRRRRRGPRYGMSAKAEFSSEDPLKAAISQSTSESLGRTVNLARVLGGDNAGGGWAATMVVVDTESDERFFVNCAANATRRVRGRARDSKHQYHSRSSADRRGREAGKQPSLRRVRIPSVHPR
jgi:hypothetical protein